MQELVSDVHCIIDAMIGKESGVGLLCPCSEGVPDVVLGDPDRLRGILLNLYTNAAKFTRRGAIAMRVSVAGPGYRCAVPYPLSKGGCPTARSAMRPAAKLHLGV